MRRIRLCSTGIRRHSSAPQDQSCFRHQRIPQESRASQHPTTRRCRTIRALWSSQLQTGLACRTHPYRGRRGLVPTLASQRRDPGAVLRLVVRCSVAWTAPHCQERLQVLPREILSRTTQPRIWHRPEVGMSPRSTAHAPCAALSIGRPARSPRLPSRARCCRLAPASRSRVAAPLRLACGGSRPPRSWLCRYAPGRHPVGRIPRLGRVETRLGPAWVRYRHTATPEHDPPSTSRGRVLVPGRHRARLSRPRVTLP